MLHVQTVKKAKLNDRETNNWMAWCKLKVVKMRFKSMLQQIDLFDVVTLFPIFSFKQELQ